MPGCRSTWYLVGFRCLHPHHNQQRCSPCPFRMRRKDRHNHKFHYTISTLKRIKKTRNYSPTGTKCIILEENVRIMYCQLYKSSSSFGTRLWNCLHILIGVSLRKACFKDKFINCSSLYSGLRMIYVDTHSQVLILTTYNYCTSRLFYYISSFSKFLSSLVLLITCLSVCLFRFILFCFVLTLCIIHYNGGLDWPTLNAGSVNRNLQFAERN